MLTRAISTHYHPLIDRETTRNATLKSYKKAGRWIVRIHGPWLDLNHAFRLGLAEDGFFENEEEECDGYVLYFTHICTLAERTHSEGSDENKDAYVSLYRAVLSQVPNFKKTLEEFGDDFESIMDLILLVSATLLFSWRLMTSVRWTGNHRVPASKIRIK